MNQRVSFYTLGCRLNQAETAALQHAFEGSGYPVVTFGEECDIVVVNTCTVTANGDADTRRLVNRIQRKHPGVKVALIGCQAQLQAQTLAAYPGVRWVVGTAEKMQLPLLIAENPDGDSPIIHLSEISKENFTMPAAAIDRYHTRANLKIQDGCNFFCSFCEIPYARGRSRSREFNDILSEARQLVDAGHREVIVTGINVGCYNDENKSFTDVLEGLLSLNGLERLRISSIEPTTIGHHVLNLMNESPKLCRYLHVPLQSGCDSTLKRMNRRYRTAEFKEFIDLAYHTVPDICLGTDIMVGFPGETDGEFATTLDFVKLLPLGYMHVFSYSERKNAKASKIGLPDVMPQDKKIRSKSLRTVSEEKRTAFMSRYLHTTQTVLAEQQKDGVWSGLTDNFIRVKFESDAELRNQLVNVSLTAVVKDVMIGELASG